MEEKSQAQPTEMVEIEPDHWASNTNDTLDKDNGEEIKTAEAAGKIQYFSLVFLTN